MYFFKIKSTVLSVTGSIGTLPLVAYNAAHSRKFQMDESEIENFHAKNKAAKTTKTLLSHDFCNPPFSPKTCHFVLCQFNLCITNDSHFNLTLQSRAVSTFYNLNLIRFYSAHFSLKEKCPTITVTFFSDHRPHTDRSTSYRNY